MANVTYIKQHNLQLVAEIGRGGFSSVFKAIYNQQEVAAKRLHKINKHELEILCSLQHPNIVELIGVVDENFEFLLVLELCHNGSLRSYLDRRHGERLSTKHFFEWSKQAARPIKYLKEMKIIHKDIKSPNNLITIENILKLCDFGSAKVLAATINNATTTASYAWMAPELLRDCTLSPSYDIHSFGVVLWELWTLLMPFFGLEPQVIVWKICHDHETLVIPEDCPKSLADLIKSCWEVDWKKRPTIDHILAKLSSCEEEVTLLVQWQFISGPWIKVNEFGLSIPTKLSDPRSVAVNNDSDAIAVLDAQDEEVKVFFMEGRYKFSIDTNGGVSEGTAPPWNVVFTGISFFVTNSTQYVHVYDEDGQFNTKWAAMSHDHKMSDSHTTKLQGLGINAQGMILVGESIHRYISIHEQDGVHVSSIKTDIRPYYLAVTSEDTIVVCDHKDNAVQIIDRTGHVISKLRPKRPVKYWQPKGMCCHDDMIFICNYAVAEYHGICCFSLSGDFLGAIGTEKWPLSIAYVKQSDRFVVTHKKKGGVAVYLRMK